MVVIRHTMPHITIIWPTPRTIEPPVADETVERVAKATIEIFAFDLHEQKSWRVHDDRQGHEHNTVAREAALCSEVEA